MWNTMIMDNPNLWRDIELTEPKIFPRALQRYLQLAKRQLYRVCLKEYTCAWTLQCITQECDTLHTLGKYFFCLFTSRTKSLHLKK